MAEENSEIQEEVIEESEMDGESNSMIWISSLSGFLSWVVLVVFVLLVVMNVVGSLQQGMQLGLNLSTLFTVINWLLLLGVGGSLFLILQAVAKGILVLLDIQEYVALDRKS